VGSYSVVLDVDGSGDRRHVGAVERLSCYTAWQMGRSSYVFQSSYDVVSVAELLRQSIDREQRSLFSMSGYKGDRPLVGEVGDNTFRMRKRRNYRNDFASVLQGQFRQEFGGTRIEVQIAAPRWSRVFMWLWLSGVIVLGVPIFVVSLGQAMNNTDRDAWMGLVVPPAMILFGIFCQDLANY
jgi:hypothetical protein